MMFKNKYLLLTLLLLASTSAGAAEIGRVLLASGETHALRGGQPVRLAYGDLIQDRDVLRTGAASNLQVRFNDESVISLRENSELGIDSFQFGKAVGPNEERSLLRLLKGGLRTITGLVGRNRPQNYSLSTVTATIGIRGTDYAATLCQGDCRNDDGTAAKDGLYGRVIGQSGGNNRISITNERFERVFGIDENFYVADARSEPQRLLEAPPFVTNRLEGRGRAENRDKSAGSGTERAEGGGSTQDSRGTTDRIDPAPQRSALNSYSVSEERTASGGVAVLQASQGMLISVVDRASGVFVLPGQLTFSDGKLITYNVSGTDNGNAFTATGSTTAANVVDSGNIAAANTTWGRWAAGTFVFNGTSTTIGPAPSGNLHYLVADLSPLSVIAAKTGTATFARVGGTTPTDSVSPVNTANTFSFGNISVDFTSRTATLASLNMQFPTGVSYGFSAVPLTMKASNNAMVIEGSKVNSTGCVGGPCSVGATATLTVSGAFVGAAGNHIGAAFKTQSVAGTTSSVQVFGSP